MKQFSDSRYAWMSPNAPFSPSAFDALLAESQIVGSGALPLTNVADGARKSAMVNGSGRLANAVDSLTVGGIPFVSIMNGAKNLVPADLTDWSKDETSGGTVDCTVNSVTCTQPTGLSRAYIKKGMNVTSGLTYTVTAYINSNNFTGGAGVFLAKVGVGGTFTENFSSGQTGLISLTFTATDTGAAEIRVGPGSGGTSGVGVVIASDVRVVQSAVTHAAPPVGSIVNYTYATDLPSCSPTYAASGTIMQLAIPYGYSGANNPASAAARLWDEGVILLASPGSVALQDSVSSINTSGSVVDGAPSVMSSDWNGSLLGARFSDSYSRTTVTQTDTPAGLLYIGNTSIATRPFHGIIATLIFPWVLSDAEYEIVRQGLLNLAGSIVLQ